MKEFIIENMEVIVSFITMLITWFLGIVSKKSSKIQNNKIPLQNMIIMLLACMIYYYATGSMSAVVASGSPVATLIYDALHGLNKEEEE